MAKAATSEPADVGLRRFEVRLEAQDGSGHFRVMRVAAPSAEAARKLAERKELETVLWEIPDDRIADLLDRHADTLGVKHPKGTGPAGEVTRLDLVDALDQFPKSAPFDATPEEKRVFLDALKQGDRAMLHAHFQDQPYKVVSVDEWTRD